MFHTVCCGYAHVCKCSRSTLHFMQTENLHTAAQYTCYKNSMLSMAVCYYCVSWHVCTVSALPWLWSTPCSNIYIFYSDNPPLPHLFNALLSPITFPENSCPCRHNTWWAASMNLAWQNPCQSETYLSREQNQTGCFTIRQKYKYNVYFNSLVEISLSICHLVYNR